MNSRRRFLGTMAAAAAAPALTALPAAAATSVKLLTIVVGYPPGGGTDVLARLVGAGMQGTYADSVIVENRAGAGGRIAAEYVKNSKPDGSTFLYTPSFPMVIYPHIYKDMRYDTLTDFDPVAMTHRGVMALSIGPAVPSNVKTLRDFVAWCKATPSRVNFFGAPAGSSQHFTGVLLAKAAGINFQLVDYKGGAPSIVDTLGGQISSTITALSEVTPYLNDPRMRILASSGAERSPVVPKLPTMAETYKDCVIQNFSGFFSAAKTPKDLIAAANVATNRAVLTKKIHDEMLVLGSNPLVAAMSPQTFGANVKSDWLRYQTLVKQTGFVAED